MKKILTLMFTLCLVACLFAASGLTANAATEDDYLYTVTDGEATITGYLGSESSLSIPSSLGGYTVTAIGDKSFQNENLAAVTIPKTVTTIGDYAFSGCQPLSTLMIPKGVITIGDYAFSGCLFLETVTIPESVTTIGDYAFSGCSLTSIDVESSNAVYVSEDGVLFDKAKTTLIQYPNRREGAYTIPDGVTVIGDAAFRSCSYLTSINIPNSVTSIGDFAFYECRSLKKLVIPDSVTVIGSYAFYYCYSMKVVTIGSGVTTIEEAAFSDCESLKMITIPKSITTIEYRAFDYCPSLTDVYYSGSEADRANILISETHDFNICLLNATWHYSEESASSTTKPNEPDAQDPCAKGHTFEAGYCVFCQAENPIGCDRGKHNFANGICRDCWTSDPNYVAPTTPEKDESASGTDIQPTPEKDESGSGTDVQLTGLVIAIVAMLAIIVAVVVTLNIVKKKK